MFISVCESEGLIGGCRGCEGEGTRGGRGGGGEVKMDVGGEVEPRSSPTDLASRAQKDRSRCETGF